MLPEENLKGRLSAFQDCRGIVEDERITAILDARIHELETVLGDTGFPTPAPEPAATGSSPRRKKKRAPKKKAGKKQAKRRSNFKSETWKAKDDQFLADHPELKTRELAARLGRTTRAIYARRAALGLSKTRKP